MTKHTQGPWQIHWIPQSNSAEIETVEQESGKYRHMTNQMPMCAGVDAVEMVKDEHSGREYRYSAESCANARLMSISPEMFDILELVAAGNTEFDVLETKAKELIARLGY